MKTTIARLHTTWLLLAVSAMFAAGQLATRAKRAASERMRDETGSVTLEQAVVGFLLVGAGIATIAIVRTKMESQANAIPTAN